MLQSTMLILTREQSGAQPSIETLDIDSVADAYEAALANVERDCR